MPSLKEIFDGIIDPLLKEAKDVWKNPNAAFAKYRELEIDKRGSLGERFFTQTFIDLYRYNRRFSIRYRDGDQGDWDIEINGWKFEVKTSSLDVNKKFQNEGLKKEGDYDAVMFLGIAPEQLYVKFVAVKDIPFDKLHSREKAKTGRGYKWDFKLGEMAEVNDPSDIQKEFERSCGFVLTPKK